MSESSYNIASCYLRPCQAMARQTLLQRRAKGSLALNWILVFIAALVLVLALCNPPSAGRQFAIAFGVGTPIGMMCLMWWVYLLGSLAEQCSPTAARLIPRQRQRAMLVAAAGWSAATLIMTLAVGLPLGAPLHVAVIFGLILLELWVLNYGWRLTAGCILISYAPRIGIPVDDWIFAFLRSDPAAACGLFVVAFELRRFLRGMGGASPYLEAPSLRPSAALNPRIGATAVRIDRVLMAIFGKPHDDRPLFMRVLRSQANGAGRAELIILVVLCGALAGWNAFRGKDAHAELQVARGIVVIVLMIVQIFTASGVLESFALRISEQGLVRLAAGTPNASEMNQIMAAHFVRRLAWMWCSYTMLSVVVVLCLGATLDEAWRVLAVSCFALPIIGVPLADHARETSSLSVLLGLISFMTISGTLIAGAGVGDLVVWGVAAVAAACGAGCFVRIRWERMVRAAPAFPAHRA